MAVPKDQQYKWTPERVALLRKLWADGRTSGEIARLLGGGVTRNAVVGKAHRINLLGRDSPIRRKQRGSNVHNVYPVRPPKERARFWTEERKRILVAGYAKETAVSPSVLAKNLGCGIQRLYEQASRMGLKFPRSHSGPAPQTKRSQVFTRKSPPAFTGSRDVPMEQLGPRDCRFPTTSFHARSHLFCGRSVETPGQPYCEFHHGIAHALPEPARDAEPVLNAAE